MKDKERILITQRSINIPNSSLVKILKDHYKIDNIIVNKKNAIKNIIHIIKNRKKYKKVIIIAGPGVYAWIISKLIPKKTELIFFIYDIKHFMPKSKNIKQKLFDKIRLFCEKQLLLRADKIIHKGLENELEFLPFYDKIKNKPHYLFREFLDKDLIQEYDPNIKLSKKDGEIHLVYVGGLYLNDRPYAESFWNFYPKITNQNIHLHIYSKQPQKIVKKLKEIESNNKYFHYEGFFPHEKLIRELTKYDYGLCLFGNDNSEHLFLKTAFTNKNYDYICAKIPIITSDNLKTIKNFVEKEKIGFSIKYENIKNLKNIILKDKRKYKFSEFINKNLKEDKFLKFIRK